ncbi:IQ domain-containing protein IQM6 [Vigna unguiculata]|nr:IQ domain-containing protein IQM6 [Vigna unguiculata]
MMVGGSVELETMFSLRSPKADLEKDFGKPESTKSRDSSGNWLEKNTYMPLRGAHSIWDQAALRLQKVYKSFRTRRQLADCAVLAEQRWWKALDFAELKRSSISFFDIEKPETAVSRWSRARKRAAKVGKGLSKDVRARKLALQHWLEAIDPRHRYGHNLQFYYVKWLRCDSCEPFFYWLDVGEGKEVLSERCSRLKLQQQCIKYLGPVERMDYEVVIENGRLMFKKSGKPVDTTGKAKWIFVLSTSKTLYVGQKTKGTFQHSSFLAGGATLSAGRLVAEDGVLRAVWPHSGHYLPTEENFEELMSFLVENNVDLTDVKKNPDEEEEHTAENNQDIFQHNILEAMKPPNIETESHNTSPEKVLDLTNEDSNAHSTSQPPLSKLSLRLGSKIARIEIPKRVIVPEFFGEQESGPRTQFYSPIESDSSGYETAEESFINEEEFMVSKSNMFVEHQNEDGNTITKEQILKRIDSHKGRKSYQLANHLSTKWTTGAGPRIGCMRDYPLELQNLILEQQNLSPRIRTTHPSPRLPSLSRFSPHVAFPPSLPDAPSALSS